MLMRKNNVLCTNAIISSQLKSPSATALAVLQTPYGLDHLIQTDRAGTADATLTNNERSFRRSVVSRLFPVELICHF